MNYLVVGCRGMAGHIVSTYLQEQGHEVYGFARNHLEGIKTICGDAREIEKIIEIIKEKRIDIVVNCIGVLNKKANNDIENAIFVNSYFPHLLAKESNKLGAKVVQISTDCVFSGKKGGYLEGSHKDGETIYDKTKALGELEDDINLTLRQSIVGPDINESGIGLLNWFMKQDGPIEGYSKCIWTGQTTLQLAKTIEYCVKHNATGVFNAVPQESISKYELLQLFNKYFREGQIEIIESDRVKIDKSLLRSNYSCDFEIPSYETMIKELKEWVDIHMEKYPTYYKAKEIIK